MPALTEYTTVRAESESELTINKSIFIANIAPVSTKEDAEAFIQKIGKKYYDATHNCRAYILGQTQKYEKSSDDGEPKGTAGTPILEVIRKKELTDTIIVVTRYFGGIKLGAGGLIRAYTKAAALCAENAEIVYKKPCFPVYVKTDYTYIGKLKNYAEKNRVLALPPEYMEKVSFKFFVPRGSEKKLIQDIKDLTSADAEIIQNPEIYIDKTKDNYYIDGTLLILSSV